MTAGLRFAAVDRRFGDRVALRGLELECPAGELTCFVGPNGAGKSTALALAAGLLAPDAGRVLVAGREVRREVAPRSTGYLPQRSAFHRSFSVGEVLDFTQAARGAGSAARGHALAVSGLADVLDRLVGELSGGWVRRLGLLSALLGSPRLLLLDEPFAGLDPETHDRLLADLAERLATGATIVVASHDFEAVDSFSPRVVVLDEGETHLVASVSAAAAASGESWSSSRLVYRRALGAEPPAAPGEGDR